MQVAISLLLLSTISTGVAEKFGKNSSHIPVPPHFIPPCVPGPAIYPTVPLNLTHTTTIFISVDSTKIPEPSASVSFIPVLPSSGVTGNSSFFLPSYPANSTIMSSHPGTAISFPPSGSVTISTTITDSFTPAVTAGRPSTTQSTSRFPTPTLIPPAPEVGGTTNTFSTPKGREKVWWLAFLVPLLLAVQI